VTCSLGRRGRGGLWLWLSSSLPVCAAAPVRGQAGAPAAPRWQARARTNELGAGKRRPMIGSEEQPPAGLACAKVAGWFPGARGRRSGSHMHPFGACLVAGRHDRDSGDRAAQSGQRARPGRLMRSRELTRGWRPSRLAGRTGAGGVGEQVAGAGEQLAGDRRGGDLRTAALGDALVAGGEERAGPQDEPVPTRSGWRICWSAGCWRAASSRRPISRQPGTWSATGCYADVGIASVMPGPGLCRCGAGWPG
jgi:hypothetical protein